MGPYIRSSKPKWTNETSTWSKLTIETGTQGKLTNEKGTWKKIEQRDGYLKSQTLQIIRELDQKMTKTADS